ncbi:MAG: hypothetical protein DYH08_09260 [Actinobacteria bacterium ATB1]|nr:hypothetical protein [Actinobacteria bacterium ATB1]
MREPSSGDANRSHAVRPHTADVIIEAYGQTRVDCLAEAVAALAEVYAERPSDTDSDADSDPHPAPYERVRVAVGADDALGRLLEEALLLLDSRGLVCFGAELSDIGDEVVGDLLALDVAAVEVTGSAPKGVADPELEHIDGGGHVWHARAIIDV